MKKKTQAEYESELAIKNPTIKVIGKYIDMKTPISHCCTVHNVVWDISPDSALRGSGCGQCKLERFRKKTTKTKEQYEKELKDKNLNVILVGKYINARTPTTHYCLNHDIIWDTSPTNILQGYGCPACGAEKTRLKLLKSHEQYEIEVKEINPDIDVIGEYDGAQVHILHKCKKDGYEWMATPSNILSGGMCPMCTGNIAWTTERYCQAVRDINPNIEVLGEYVGARTPILHKCKIDNYEWKTTPDCVLHKVGCPMCGNKTISQKLSKTHKQYVKEVSMYNPDIEVLGKYVGATTPILHRCKKDGHEWMIAPSNVLSGCGCPQCKESKGERIVRQWLERNKVIYKFQYRFPNCKDKRTLPFDFYLPEYNTCIEYDGGQHFFPADFSGKGAEYTEQQFKTTQYHDQIKNQYCADNGITLLRIPYFKNVEEELNNFFIHLV